MSAGSIDPVLALVNEVRFAFQPLINVKTGAIVAVEALARPTGGDVHDLFREAARHRRLTELDVELARSAVTAAADHETLLPLHLNLFGGTLTHDLPRIERLRERLHEVGRREHEVTLEIGPPFARLDPGQLVEGVQALKADGFQIAGDGVGDGDVPLALIADMEPGMVKLDRGVVSGLPDSAARRAVLEAVRHLCEAADADLVAEGVENDRQLSALRRTGVRLVQGNLLAPPARRPPTTITVPGVAAEVTDPAGQPVNTLAAGPRVTEFLSPATLLPVDATADKVRGVLADHPEISAVGGGGGPPPAGGPQAAPPGRRGRPRPAGRGGAGAGPAPGGGGGRPPPPPAGGGPPPPPPPPPPRRSTPSIATGSCSPSPVRTGTRCTRSARLRGWPTNPAWSPPRPPPSRR
ncbi:EAL domain-containing protein [Saccharopolyspora sp. 6V]|uniref:EAL domain-containing protein n=1 Tax=Saccharopolyspora sp. 6V TaxID=2877239 RepID=UPI0035A90276